MVVSFYYQINMYTLQISTYLFVWFFSPSCGHLATGNIYILIYCQLVFTHYCCKYLRNIKRYLKVQPLNWPLDRIQHNTFMKKILKPNVYYKILFMCAFKLDICTFLIFVYRQCLWKSHISCSWKNVFYLLQY